MIPFTSFNQTALYTYIKVKPQNTKETLNYIQKTWNMFYDKSVFNFQFADQIIANMNSDTIILRNLLGLLLIVTIISVCFGIYSISSFTVKIKTNEAVIRKIHGSSNFQIVKLISYAYLKNITISLIISIPTAYYISMNIISNYAYRIDFPFKAFIYSFFIMLIIVFITISSLIIRISKANPVEVLKEE
jgi:ABC-type antimicrobial peptide transport system permease subunit